MVNSQIYPNARPPVGRDGIVNPFFEIKIKRGYHIRAGAIEALAHFTQDHRLCISGIFYGPRLSKAEDSPEAWNLT